VTSASDVSFIEALLSTDARARMLLEVAFAHRENIPPDVYAEYARVFRDPRTTDIYLWIANHDLFKELSARKGDDSRYQAITCPTLVLWGEQDRVVPRDVFTRLCSTLPDATCELVADCGHTPAEERPGETVLQIQRFLNNHVQPPVGPTIVLSPELPDLPVMTDAP
jgi:pimeloyl-ACP methyl ester carboxylesterase